MLEGLPAQMLAAAWSLAMNTACIAIAFWVIERVVVQYRLKKVHGVRASILGGNPLTCTKLSPTLNSYLYSVY